MVNTEVPLIIHVIHALSVGGLENGLVNLINTMPADRYRHAIVCMTDYTEFRRRIHREDVEVIAMKRGSAPIWRTYLALLRLFRAQRPAIVHSRNLSGLDALVPAWCAGVSVRVHSEHGRDANDLDGRNPKNLRLRKLFRPWITHYVTVSRDLERYLAEVVGVSPVRISQIYNGVDTERFCPAGEEDSLSTLIELRSAGTVLIGTVGRLQTVKDQVCLVDAFAQACRMAPDLMDRTRLLIVGDGPSRHEIVNAIERNGLGNRVIMAGERSDVPELMRALDLFVLPSLSEGISNTILEAMASGLPVLATRVGGNPELITEGETGQMVAAGDRQAMAQWLIAYARDAELRKRQGEAGRRRVERQFSIASMVRAYLGLYDALLAGNSPRSLMSGTAAGR